MSSNLNQSINLQTGGSHTTVCVSRADTWAGGRAVKSGDFYTGSCLLRHMRTYVRVVGVQAQSSSWRSS